MTLLLEAGAAALVAWATMSHAFADTKGPTPTDKPVTLAQASESGATVGTIDGKSWAVSIKYYPKVPKGFPSKPGVSTAKAGVLCTRVTIGDVRVDEKGGRWADCAVSTGTPAGGAGLYGLADQGLTGTRVSSARPPIR